MGRPSQVGVPTSLKAMSGSARFTYFTVLSARTKVRCRRCGPRSPRRCSMIDSTGRSPASSVTKSTKSNTRGSLISRSSVFT